MPRYRSRDGTHLTVCAVETGGRQQTATVGAGLKPALGRIHQERAGFKLRHRATILADAIILRQFLYRRATIISSRWDQRTRTFKLAHTPSILTLNLRRLEKCLKCIVVGGGIVCGLAQYPHTRPSVKIKPDPIRFGLKHALCGTYSIPRVPQKYHSDDDPSVTGGQRMSLRAEGRNLPKLRRLPRPDGLAMTKPQPRREVSLRPR